MDELKEKVNSALLLIESICDLLINDLQINGIDKSLSKLDIARTSLLEFKTEIIPSKQDGDALELNGYKKELIVKREDTSIDIKGLVKKVKLSFIDTNGSDDNHSEDEYIPDLNDQDPLDDRLEPKVEVVESIDDESKENIDKKEKIKVPKKFTEDVSVKERVQCLRCNSFIYQKNYETHTKKCLPKKCSKCDKVLKNRGALRTHMKTHTAGAQCPICNKTFSNSRSLEFHIASHSTATCEICGMLIKGGSTSNLKAHMKTHQTNRERTKSCDICGKLFFRDTHVRKHKLTHSAERPFACDKCELTFKLDYSLKRHLEESHGIAQGKPDFKCDVCGKTFSIKNIFKRHEERCLKR